MNSHPRQLMLKGAVRRFCALAFLFFLLFEWGSHGVAFAHSMAGHSNSAQSEQEQHEDICKTLIRCSDNRRPEVPTPNGGQHIAQHNAVFDRFLDAGIRFYLQRDPSLQLSNVRALLQPPNPPFHPPELS